MLSEEKAMEILEAYDLTRSFRSAAALCGVDHHTVRRYVAARAAGLDPATPSAVRPSPIRSPTRSPSGSSAPVGRSGPTWSTASSWPWASSGPSAPPDGWWPA